ncbi:MAG: isoprenylcysteine carboxylmethyltransferase family protein [Sphingomicrobium sp.]
MTDAAIVILALVTTQRLAELWLSHRNTRRLVAHGAVEHCAGHYPLLVMLHAAWLAALWWWAPGRSINWALMAFFVLLQLARLWVIATLGQRWTTRIIVLPAAPLVRAGPYRFVAHPNYLIVALEVAALPLAFGLVGVALVFSLLNAAVLAIRIRAENEALGHG